MSSEVQLDGIHARFGGGNGSEAFDRVLWTASERPVDDSLPALIDPAADHQGGEVARRRSDVDAKHRRVIGFLDDRDLDAILLRRADSIAWFTAGGDLGRDLGSEAGAVDLFINRTTRAILADNVQSPRIFEEELAGLGFQLKERPWTEDPSRLIGELTRRKRVATDGEAPNLIREADDLKALRFPLTTLERENLRSLGRTLTLAIEATCRNFMPGETEADIAGHLAHRLLREGVEPISLRVAGDDRLSRYRQPRFKAAEIRRRATIAATGRRHGLCASATRTVSFGPIDDEFRANHTLASMVEATCIYFSRPGEPISEVYRRSRRIYEKFGHPHEWNLDYQGAVTGYSPIESCLLPDSSYCLEAGSALRWSPSVGAARSEDTVVIDDRGFEVVTEAQNWPKVDVMVKGFTLPRPGVLER
ncbi:M24 family metallopeptidase [Tundrisphaera lichenicola]|uniref:M24 family metallopeptidase n=1 Tax=Tundrisphaera lichenicola TaxID=2029860 RepID=UPI003EC14884